MPQAAFSCPEVVPCIPRACFDALAPASRIPTQASALNGSSGGAQSRNVTLLSQLTLTQIGGQPFTTRGSSLYGWTDPATNREYAIMGRSDGTAFVDVTNPTQPLYVANLPSQNAENTQWREPKVFGNHVYIGVDDSNVGLQVMDLTRLRNYAGTTLQLTADSVFAPTVTYTDGGGVPQTRTLSRAHTLAINPASGHLYAAGTNLYDGGLFAIDVRDPGNPQAAGGYLADNYIHEAQVVRYNGPDAQHRGREIAFNANSIFGRLTIADVTDKSSPTRLSSKGYPNEGFIHQGWLTEDQRYFFQNDELDEHGTTFQTRTHLWDVSDLDNPVYRGFWDNTTTSTDHNLYVKNGFVYQTNYTTGLRILKIGDLSSNDSSQWLTEVAYYDTYPANDDNSFHGAWNNYPFFGSGNIIVSDIDGGLFVLRADLPGNGAGDLIHPRLIDPAAFALLPEPGGAMGVIVGLSAVARLYVMRLRAANQSGRPSGAFGRRAP